MKKKLKKINLYILDDWGVDLHKTWLKIYNEVKNSIVTRILLDLLILLFAGMTSVVLAGSIFALFLVNPIFIFIYLLGSLILLLFAFKPNYVFDLFKGVNYDR